MTTGNEIMLGFPYKSTKLFNYFCDNIFKGTQYENFNFRRYIEKMEIQKHEYDEITEKIDRVNKKFRIFKKSLLYAQKCSLMHIASTSDVKHIKRKTYNWDMVTDKGQRNFRFFKLYWDKDYDEDLENSVIGISVSGRYTPTFVDYENKQGTLYPIIFDAKTKKLMNLAKIYISENIPIFKKALWCVKEMRY